MTEGSALEAVLRRDRALVSAALGSPVRSPVESRSGKSGYEICISCGYGLA